MSRRNEGQRGNGPRSFGSRGFGSQTSVATAPVYDSQVYPEWVRWLGVFALTIGLVLAWQGERHGDNDLIAFALAGAALGRGIGLRRPLLALHVFGAIGLLIVAGVADQRGNIGLAQAAVVLGGIIAFWAPPSPPPGTPAERHRVRSLVNTTAGDPLAPFALRADKSYAFSADGLAAVAYRVRFGVLAVSGDPVGAVESREAAALEVLRLVEANAWRLSILGASEQWTQWWRAQGVRALPIGRDVVVDVDAFTVTGRSFRNLRQAVQRTRNAGVTTAVYPEMDLPADLAVQLRAIVDGSRRNERRGYSMMLDNLLRPTQRGTLVTVAFDRDGAPVAFHRFGTADSGREISQDLPWRAPNAPNGVDERLTFDTIMWAREHGAKRVSLSFAAFPELYEQELSSRLEKVAYWGSHRLDRFIRLESLYRYLRKFHAFSERRYVLLRLRDVVPVAAALITLEFSGFRSEDFVVRRWIAAARIR